MDILRLWNVCLSLKKRGLVGLPEGSFAIATLIVVALPGFISAGIRRWARGEFAEDRVLGLSIARGTTFAVVLTGLYLLIGGDGVFESLQAGKGTDTIVISDPRRLAVTVLVLYVVVPAVVAMIVNRTHIEWKVPAKLEGATNFRWVRLPSSKHGYKSTPSAWDHATIHNHHAWVKVQRSDGQWIGGWYTKGSFATTYPEPRSLYIARQYEMDDNGDFGDEIPNTGIFIMVGDGDLVFWTRPPISEEQENYVERQKT